MVYVLKTWFSLNIGDDARDSQGLAMYTKNLQEITSAACHLLFVSSSEDTNVAQTKKDAA